MLPTKGTGVVLPLHNLEFGVNESSNLTPVEPEEGSFCFSALSSF